MAGRKNPYLYDPEYYVHGDTVRKIKADGAVPSTNEPARKNPARPEPARRQPLERGRQDRGGQEQEERRLVRLGRGVGFLGMLILAASILATAYCCIGYLKLRADSSRLDKEIAALEEELAGLATANAAKEEKLVGSINLDQIYQTAVGELGMVFPNHNEVVYYDSVDTSYVRQYADIPETVTSILDKLVP